MLAENLQQYFRFTTCATTKCAGKSGIYDAAAIRQRCAKHQIHPAARHHARIEAWRSYVRLQTSRRTAWTYDQGNGRIGRRASCQAISFRLLI
jgi:hypothetical protein